MKTIDHHQRILFFVDLDMKVFRVLKAGVQLYFNNFFFGGMFSFFFLLTVKVNFIKVVTKIFKFTADLYFSQLREATKNKRC